MTDTAQNLRINTIRILSADAVQHANSGHPGLPMGAAALGYTLWTDFLKFNPKNPSWPDRDRFVLSAGHGSMLLYSLLYLTGYDLALDDIKHFRQLESRTPGHPERGVTPGVEVSTGPLGQGFANGVGLAIAEAWLSARYNREDLNRPRRHRRSERHDRVRPRRRRLRLHRRRHSHHREHPAVRARLRRAGAPARLDVPLRRAAGHRGRGRVLPGLWPRLQGRRRRHHRSLTQS